MPSAQQSGGHGEAPSLTNALFETINRRLNLYHNAYDGANVDRSVLLLVLVAAFLLPPVIWLGRGNVAGQRTKSGKQGAPPAIPELIPFVSNAIGYMTRPKPFLERAA